MMGFKCQKQEILKDRPFVSKSRNYIFQPYITGIDLFGILDALIQFSIFFYGLDKIRIFKIREITAYGIYTNIQYFCHFM